MSAGLDLSNDVSKAMMLAQSAPIKKPGIAVNETAAKKAAGEFEGVLISQMLGSMFEGISTDGPFGGGQGEAMFRSLMLDEYGKQLSKRGGLGLTNAIVKSLLSHQEAKANAATDASVTTDATASDQSVPTNASAANLNAPADRTANKAKFFSTKPTQKNAIIDPSQKAKLAA